MADATSHSLEQFKDASRWKINRGVPIFIEHERKLSDGSVMRFGRTDLDEIAANCNRREQLEGTAAPLIIGHIVPGMKEEDIGDTVGYARNFRVGPFGPAKKIGVLYDEYIFPAKYSKSQEFPRRSAELWRSDKILDPICLLKRTPWLNLGQVIPDAQVQKVGADGASLLTYSRGPDRLVVAFDEEDAMNEQANLLYAKLLERLDAIEARLPKAGANDPPKPPAPTPAEKVTYTRQEVDDLIAQANRRAEDERKRADARIAAIESDAKEAKVSYARRQELNAMANDGYVFDLEEELTEGKGLDDAAWGRKLSKMRLRYARDGGRSILPIGGPLESGTKELTREQMEKAIRYSEEHECDWNEAVQAIRQPAVA